MIQRNKMENKTIQNSYQNDPLIEFKVNDSLLTRNSFMGGQQIVPSAFVPIQNSYYPSGYPYVHSSGNPQYPYHFTPNNVPIIKNYNLSMPNPSGDHFKYADLYEDALPQEKGVYKNSSITLEERLEIFTYVREVFIRTSEGEEISINSKLKDTREKKNLLSHIKLLDFQPYHTSKISNNPYTHAGTDKMYIYNTCYPHEYDEVKGNTACHRFSISLNLRIYQMSIAEYNVNRLENFNHNEFNLWRELIFYQYVRNEILKKKICPNFPIYYSYFLTSGAIIDFDKLKDIKRSLDLRSNRAAAKLDERTRKKYIDELSKKSRVNLSNIKGLNSKELNSRRHGEYLEETKKAIDSLRKSNEINIDGTIKKPFSDKERKNINLEYSRYKSKRQITDSMDKCLLIVTEAPNYNILRWATLIYNPKPLGPVKTTAQSGHHSKSEWMSVIFQLMAALQTMYYKKFAFVNMQLENNVFIKDLKNKEQTMGYWRYIINGISYFVPNEGFLLMIDSDFREVTIDNDDFLTKPEKSSDSDSDLEDKEYYKIYGKIDSNFDKDSKNQDKLDKLQYDNIKNLLSDDNFSLSFRNYGGITPDDEILKMLKDIKYKILNKKNEDGDLSDIFLENKNIQKYLHNRVGTFLTDEEKKFVNTESKDFEIQKGDLIPYTLKIKEKVEEYRWAIVIDEIDSSNIKCYDKDLKGNIIIKSLPKVMFNKYESYDPEQEYKSDLKLVDVKELSTYNIKKEL